MKFMKKSMDDRGHQQSSDADDHEPAEKGIEGSEQLAGGSPYNVNRPHPPRIIEAFSRASIQGNRSRKW